MRVLDRDFETWVIHNGERVVRIVGRVDRRIAVEPLNEDHRPHEYHSITDTEPPLYSVLARDLEPINKWLSRSQTLRRWHERRLADIDRIEAGLDEFALLGR